MTNIDWSKAPEGATHYRVGANFPWHNFNSKSFYSDIIKGWMPYGRHDHFERAMAGAIPRPTEQPQWNGEGLPPVGTECEVTHSGLVGAWERVCVCSDIIELDEEGFPKVAMLTLTDNLHRKRGSGWFLCNATDRDVKFRPIKSDRDQQIDALLSVIQSLPINGNSAAIAQKLYDKGVRVEI